MSKGKRAASAMGILVFATAALLAACAGSTELPDDGAGGTPTPTPAPTSTPEGDDDVFTVAPIAEAAVVYVANPENDDVARIETANRRITVIPVGNRPLDLRVSPGGARLSTFNALSHDVSIVDLATLVETRLPVRPVTNAMVTSPQATHGVCIYSRARDASGGVSGSQNPGEVSVVDLVAKTVTSSVMGFEPRGVTFTADDARAFVLSDGLIASIDLTLPNKPKTLIAIADDPTTAPPAREILVAPDGTSALVLTQDTSAALTLVDLGTGTRTALAAGASGTVPTDLDLSADGRYYAVASFGAGGSTVDLFDRTAGFARTTIAIPGPAGSMEVAPDDDTLFVFSRSALDEHLWRIEIGGGAGAPAPVVTSYALVKPVRSVFVAPAGGGVLILHRFEDVVDGAPSSEAGFANDHVMTVLDVDAGGGIPLTSAVALEAPPDSVAVTSDGAWAFAQIPASRTALVIDLASLLVDALPLASTPLFVGAVDDGHLGYVLQRHPLGRITFIAPDTMDVDTVTGFEINGEIE